MVDIGMKELLEAGGHFGHQTRRWNPKMKPYIFGKRNGIYIIDLAKTVRLFREAAEFARQLGQEGRRILFVGTKRQAQEVVAEEARRCHQYFVTHRWLGGTLTNFVTLRISIQRLKEIEARLADEHGATTKKERLRLDRGSACSATSRASASSSSSRTRCSSSIRRRRRSRSPRRTSSASR